MISFKESPTHWYSKHCGMAGIALVPRQIKRWFGAPLAWYFWPHLHSDASVGRLIKTEPAKCHPHRWWDLFLKNVRICTSDTKPRSSEVFVRMIQSNVVVLGYLQADSSFGPEVTRADALFQICTDYDWTAWRLGTPPLTLFIDPANRADNVLRTIWNLSCQIEQDCLRSHFSIIAYLIATRSTYGNSQPQARYPASGDTSAHRVQRLVRGRADSLKSESHSQSRLLQSPCF